MVSRQPPATYHQWVACLDELEAEEHDASILTAMEAGSLAWTSGVAERFVERLARCIDNRLCRSTALLQRDLDAGRATDEAVVTALLDARRRILHAHRLAKLPVLPVSVQNELSRAVQCYADSAQEALGRSARSDRSGRLATLIRGNPLNRLSPPSPSIPSVPPTTAKTFTSSETAPAAGGLGRRRILFQ